METLADLIGQSPAMDTLRGRVRRLLQRPPGWLPPPVLLLGETGTGKGLLARLLHRAGPRGTGPFVDVNCAAIPDTLLEAELFGFERGAFTDARQAKPGLFQAAHRGTLFLDEVGLLPDGLQAKLLTAIESRQVRRLGSTRTEPVDVWILAATSADLAAAMAAKRFRRELYHRLSALMFCLPPLRARGQDVLELASHFLARAATEHGVPQKTLAVDARNALLSYGWPGNVRELANVLERVTLLEDAQVITAPMLALSAPPAVATEADQPRPSDLSAVELRRQEREELVDSLIKARGNIARAAAGLGIPRNTLRYRMAKHGLSLRDAPATWTKPASPREPREPDATRWERRHVAVLLLLLVPRPGADAASDASRALELSAQKVQVFGGHVEDLGPASLLATFGLEPVEDAPRRAAFAALAIQKAAERARWVDHPALAAQVGLHVENLLVAPSRRGWRIDTEGLGRARAALQVLVARQEASVILVTPAAVPLVERWFELTAMTRRDEDGRHAFLLKRPEQTGFGLGGRPLTPFVGRQPELAMIADRLAQVEGGSGQVVAVVGDPGVGKSRFVYEVRRLDSLRGWPTLGASCVSWGSGIPYLPVLDLVRQTCRIDETDGPDVMAAKAQTSLTEAGVEPVEWLAYLLRFLGMKEGTERLSLLSPETVKARTFELLRLLILQDGRRRPVILTVEDLHWIDNTSEEFLNSLVESVPGGRMLLLLTYRPGYRPSWIAKSYATQLALRPLSETDSLSVVHSILAPSSLPGSLLPVIVAKAEGNPFFLEELAHAIHDRGRDEAGAVAVPDTIQDVLRARIDRLPEGSRQVLQTASVIGREVPLTLLRAVWTGASSLDPHLRELQRLEFLYERRGDGPPVFVFKHALTQEVAYDSLLPPERQALHEAAGRVLEALSASHLEEHYGVLAHHYGCSANTDKAFGYLDLANQKAITANAFVEAKAYFDKAMAVLDGLVDTPVNRRRRLNLLVNQWVVFFMLYQYPEYYELLSRYSSIAPGLDDAALIGAFNVCLGHCQWAFGRLDEAIETMTHAAELCESSGNSEAAARAYVTLEWSHLWKGDYERVVPLKDAVLQVLERQFNLRFHGWAFTAVSWACSCLGRWREALAEARTSIRAAEELSDDSMVSFAMWIESIAHTSQGAMKEALESAGRALRTAPSPADKVWSQSFLAWAMCRAGEPGRGVEVLASLLPLYQATRFVSGGVTIAVCLGEGYWLAGQHEKARQTLNAARETAESCGMRFYVGWAHRVLGEISLECGEEAEAASHLEKSVGVFRAIGAENELALAYEAYGRLRKRQGHPLEARDFLARALEIFKRLGTRIDPDKMRSNLASPSSS
jgi:DNA-binding NtrC family response regulator/tetratricopeptide (TPR) repeat protein